MTIEIVKVVGYKSTCQHCRWSTTNETVKETKVTMDYHLRDACPIVGRKWPAG